jgi:hypothetical protein
MLREADFRADDVVNGQPAYRSRWVDWSPFVDEVPYARHMPDLLAARAFPRRQMRRSTPPATARAARADPPGR